MEIRCPECGNVSYSDREISQGENLRCPHCKCTFLFEIDMGSTELVPQESHEKLLSKPMGGKEVRFYDVKVLDEILGRCMHGLQDTSSLWEKILITLEIRNPVLVLCEKCWRFGVVVSSKETAWLECECHNEFTVAHGKQIFSSVWASMQSYVENGNKIAALRKKFKVEEQVFQGDWEAFNDPKTSKRIDRVKEDIDRLYRKLQLTESKRLVASHNKQTGAIMAFANNSRSTFVSRVGLMDMLIYDTQQSALGSKSLSMEEEVDRLEWILSYYYNINEEFSGVDMETARTTRLKARTGYSFANELPQLYCKEDIAKCESVIGAVERCIKEQIGKAARLVLALAAVSVFLLIISLAVVSLSYSVNMSDNAIGWCWVATCCWSVFCIGVTIKWCSRD